MGITGYQRAPCKASHPRLVLVARRTGIMIPVRPVVDRETVVCGARMNQPNLKDIDETPAGSEGPPTRNSERTHPIIRRGQIDSLRMAKALILPDSGWMSIALNLSDSEFQKALSRTEKRQSVLDLHLVLISVGGMGWETGHYPILFYLIDFRILTVSCSGFQKNARKIGEKKAPAIVFRLSYRISCRQVGKEGKSHYTAHPFGDYSSVPTPSIVSRHSGTRDHNEGAQSLDFTPAPNMTYACGCGFDCGCAQQDSSCKYAYAFPKKNS
ncbi:hypothetical protein BT96DRAFT_934794 [Gymnopus androsaceus JB14]|uniref:Uncharacterized protein n=1 Tax=Gymnopus androsaceus JB14 TaxID=1447944 RepID=A0A6A4IA16_9AGAR|nr:hypothetical protein BT96DRAFT_934794 [Gymnopus androsaceus JB14]